MRIGDPLDGNTLMGPLIDQRAVDDYLEALEKVKKETLEFVCIQERRIKCKKC